MIWVGVKNSMFLPSHHNNHRHTFLNVPDEDMYWSPCAYFDDEKMLDYCTYLVYGRVPVDDDGDAHKSRDVKCYKH